MLAGELGVGKTRLAQEAMMEAAARGFVVGAGRCYGAEQGTPYYPILEALGGLVTNAPLGARSDVERRVHEIRGLVSEGSALGDGRAASQESQRRLLVTITDLLA